MKKLSHKIKVIIGVIIFLIITLGIAFVINESYKVGKGYITLWTPADALSFYGAYLSFIGTVVLGVVAIYQNKKAQDVNEQLQKLQQAQFVSMVSVTRVILATRSQTTPMFLNTDMREIENIDLTATNYKSSQYFHIDVEFSNDSEYPIVQIITHPGQRSNVNGQLYGLKNITEQAVYIPKGNRKCYRFLVPCEMFKITNNFCLQLSLDFVNVFDYVTPASLHITDLCNIDRHNDFQFRLSKFTDIRPNK